MVRPVLDECREWRPRKEWLPVQVADVGVKTCVQVGLGSRSQDGVTSEPFAHATGGQGGLSGSLWSSYDDVAS